MNVPNGILQDKVAVAKFCSDMESTPVGVIVGLFSAISQKLPSLSEWDSQKHHTLLNSNLAICDALTEVRGHVNRHGMSHPKDQTTQSDIPNRCLSKDSIGGLIRP